MAGHHPRQDEAHDDVECRDETQRADDAHGHVALGVAALLSQRAHCRGILGRCGCALEGVVGAESWGNGELTAIA